SFHKLDNGVLRVNAWKDVGALLEWIKTQADLDADRIMVEGASYGGYMALAVAANYSDRIRCPLSDSGLSNLVTFLLNTAGWRRDLQRNEFGTPRGITGTFTPVLGTGTVATLSAQRLAASQVPSRSLSKFSTSILSCAQRLAAS